MSVSHAERPPTGHRAPADPVSCPSNRASSLRVASLQALALCAALCCTGCERPGPSPAPWPTAGTLPPPTATAEPPKVLFDEPSPYGRVIVLETGKRRCLKFSMKGGNQSCLDLDAPNRVVHEYVRYLSVGLVFAPPAPRTLMLGLGGGRAVRVLLDADPGLQMDAVEINPVVVQVAEKYFFVEPSERLRVHVADGRGFFDDKAERWNLIMLDAFGNDFIPFHLTTVEFLKIVADHLAAEGAVVANLWTRNDELFRTMVRTYSQVFPTIYLFKAKRAGNAILVAAGKDAPASCEQVLELAQGRAAELDVSFSFTEPPGRCAPLSTLKLDDVTPLRDAERERFDALGEL